ncbi:MAG: chloride channel protein [Microcoleaceae cyanobacterium]
MGQLSAREQIPKRLKALTLQILRPTSSRRIALIESCIIGFVSGLAAYCLREGAGWLGALRVSGSYNTVMPVWIFLPLVGVVGGLLTGSLVQRFAPETMGSGIPQVKAALGGLPVSLDLRVAITKLFTTMFTMGSGLTLGRQGPTVQIGAALAAWISRWVPTSPNYRRQMVASGAAAGLAAGFNAPISGVLFVAEDLLHDVSEWTLGTAIVSSFIGAVVARLLGGRDVTFEPPSPAALEASYNQWLIQLPEIPFYIILGILAGVLGTLFSSGIVRSNQLHRRLGWSLPTRMALSGLFCGLIIAFLPTEFRNNSGLREIVLDGEISWKLAVLAFVAHFTLTTIASSSSAPGGLFAPSLVLGASLGEIIGLWQANLIGMESPTTFALAGMGAFFCAVSRTPMTSVVIVFEITQDFNVVLQLMICSIVAFFTAEKLIPESLYDRLLKLSGLDPKSEQSTQETLNNLRAEDIMQRQVETIDSHFTLEQARRIFSQSRHQGFPVVNHGQLVGIFTQQDMSDATKRQLDRDTPISRLMTPQPVTVDPQDTLSHVLYVLTKHRPSRIPVIEGRNLVGIITRSDILNAELSYLECDATQIGPHPHPSYVVYRTQSPQIGQGRLLVPVQNPATVTPLLQIAASIAREHHYELECLHVITIPRHRIPSETRVKLKTSRRLLREADRVGQAWQIPVQTQARVANDVAQAILETVRERHISTLLMGWHGKNLGPNRIFGNIVDTVICQASCEVMLIRWSTTVASALASAQAAQSLDEISELYSPIRWKRWLFPIRQEAKSSIGLKHLSAFMRLSIRPEVQLMQVITEDLTESQIQASETDLEQTANQLQRHLKINAISTLTFSNSAVEAIIRTARKENCDVIVLGATQAGLLKQIIHGNVPEAIIRGCACHVILIRPGIKNESPDQHLY